MEVNKMKKEYKFNLKDDRGKWKIKYISKPNKSKLKGWIIKALWEESSGLTAREILIKMQDYKYRNIPTYQEISNVLFAYNLFYEKGKTTTKYSTGSIDNRTALWALNLDTIEYELMK